jgi:hypothetical protein
LPWVADDRQEHSPLLLVLVLVVVLELVSVEAGSLRHDVVQGQEVDVFSIIQAILPR